MTKCRKTNEHKINSNRSIGVRNIRHDRYINKAGKFQKQSTIECLYLRIVIVIDVNSRIRLSIEQRAYRLGNVFEIFIYNNRVA